MTISQYKPMLLAVAATVSIWSAAPAFAQFNQGDAVTFQGAPMFAIQGDAGGFSSKKRAWQAQDNFDNALVRSADRSPNAVNVVKENGAFTVNLGGYYITTADANSAKLAGITAEALANSWAGAIKERLSSKEATDSYLDTLQQNHPLKAGVEIVEKDVMVSDFNQLPFRLAEGTLSVSTSDPFMVVALLDRQVALDNFVLPEGTILNGTIKNFRNNNARFIKFDKATLPDGSVLVLQDVVAATVITSEVPKLVITESIPADPKSESREPATVGIGAQKAEIAVLQARPDLVAEYKVDIPL